MTELRIAIVAIDPTRRKRTGGSLLGDRIRMNAIDHPNVYMRSIATRDSVGEVPRSGRRRDRGLQAVPVRFHRCRNARVSARATRPSCRWWTFRMYVMTPEFGAQSQLEKIDMLDFADVVAINKFDRKGADDAWRDVCKQVQRNHEAFAQAPETMPVFGTIASRFNDDGTTALYQEPLPPRAGSPRARGRRSLRSGWSRPRAVARVQCDQR